MNTYAVEKLKALSKFIKKILISFGYFNFIYSSTRDPCLFLSSFVYTYTDVEQEPSIPDMNKE